MLFMGAPVNTYADDYIYDVYIVAPNGDRLRGITMTVGDTFNLNKGGPDSNALDEEKVWGSTASNVVNVGTGGKITAQQIGTATITLRHKDHLGTVLDSIVVKVVDNNSDELADYTNGVTISYDASGEIQMHSFSLYLGDTFRLSTNGAEEKVSWTSTRTDVATVDETGRVTAKGTGTTTIKATDVKHTENYGTLVITVLETPEETKDEPQPEEPKEEPKKEETTEQKQNPKTGDMAGHVHLAGVGTMLVLALGIMLQIGKNKKQTEV